MLCSLLYNATPEEVKLILVDPKRLELSVYNGIPHLLLPPITDPKKASMALRWAVDEMERRYTLMSELGVRNIKGYNKRVGKNNNATNDPLLNARDDAGQLKHSFMPYLVIIIDELADLMMVVAKEVETSIARLAQMARACGIHLILATQRPSVDVLTGLIKANFPTRLAFRVFSRHDSKTILDTIGAEALLGMGDSLFLPPSTGLLQRVHGAFVSDEEVQSLVEFLRAQGEPDYNEDILLGNADDDNPPESADTDNDELFDQAVQIVAQSGQASASMLQRKLRVGFNRAARLIEQMEAQGIVGPADGSKPREVLVSPI
jgi:S-DNA-T family DNA segregation ATPase FtsK/SpoIIIE